MTTTSSVSTPQFHSFPIQPASLLWASKHWFSPNVVKPRRDFVLSVSLPNCNRVLLINPKFRFRAAINNDNNNSANPEDEEEEEQCIQDTGKAVVNNSESESGTTKLLDWKKDPISKFQGMITTLPPFVFVMKRGAGSNLVMWLCIATAFVVVFVRVYVVRKSRPSRPGSVADLVRRGQLRSDRRGISTPLKYEDPFNNPLVKVGKSNSTIEICGKVYRLAPVTLTEEQQAIHQRRRSRAYQWKRPTIFLKEGDPIPPDVDPDTVRWIPANHPFATTASDIDEDLAQSNVYQKHGVPFRIKAEHEALQRKLEALQNEQKLNKLVIDTGNAKEFERPFRFNAKANELVEQNPLNSQSGDSKPSKSDRTPNPFNSSSSSEEMQKP
ncbi:PROTEIN MULTIPLE CHLOROPLAST DIVISION SITE 1 [Salix viminalis]|uniref:PROTEIN MULTIPLE CHLOROPLAST DIVISION SITE 1 n=1 Tax=Salix viminalis TaxID=40686 RepID=A0A9Q0ZJ46_SALVM|nr:PROTEIN MULTIPLE CHLOROPLAST DIVISION SITE 1 [Salix viminalis]